MKIDKVVGKEEVGRSEGKTIMSRAFGFVIISYRCGQNYVLQRQILGLLTTTLQLIQNTSTNQAIVSNGSLYTVWVVPLQHVNATPNPARDQTEPQPQ